LGSEASGHGAAVWIPGSVLRPIPDFVVAIDITAKVLPVDSADAGIERVDDQIIGQRRADGAEQRQADEDQAQALM
jgi:hypothetical protein